MRRLPEGFDGNTCPYIFTWSTERPNKVRGGNDESAWNKRHVDPNPNYLYFHHSSHSFIRYGLNQQRFGEWEVAVLHSTTRARRVRPTQEWFVTLMKIGSRFLLHVTLPRMRSYSTLTSR